MEFTPIKTETDLLSLVLFLFLHRADSTWTAVRLTLYICPALHQEIHLKVGQEASFPVQLNGARGLIDAKIHSPSGAVEECYITELDSGKTLSLPVRTGSLS